jgi:hypothetical protein
MWKLLMIPAASLLVALAALAAAVWVVATGLSSDLDGIFLLLVALTFVLLFSIIPIQTVRSGALRQLMPRKKEPVVEQPDPQEAQAAKQKS